MDKYDKAAIRIVWGESAARWRRYESDHPAFAKEIAAVMREVASVKWQPIDSAPRDGTTILVSRYNPTWGWIVGYARWSETRGIGGWISHGFYDPPGNLGLAHPTHWMPLPQPPGDQGR